jgi:hypothetical protein
MNLKILSQVCQFKEPMKMDLELGNKTLSLLFSDELKLKRFAQIIMSYLSMMSVLLKLILILVNHRTLLSNFSLVRN